jgi:hypothetical protein
MSFSLASTDAFPYLSGLFRCDECGHAEPTEGREAGQPPPGWVSELRAGELHHLCAHCAARQPGRR